MAYADMNASEEDNKYWGMDKLTGGGSRLRGCFGHRRMILFIVFVALFLDNMLLTVVIPIIPDFLLSHRTRNLSTSINEILLEDKYCTKLLNVSDRINLQKSIIWASRGHAIQNQPIELIDQLEIMLNDKRIKYLLFNNKFNECMVNVTRQLKEITGEELGNEHIQVGLMFASKAIVQMIVNPLIGPLTNKIGYSVPMFTGFVIMFTSTVVFAFGESYAVLFFARALQGVGSACSSVSGMGMLATCYTDDKDRSHAFSVALSGLAIGVLEAPFLILAALALADGFLQLIALKPAVRKEEQKGAALCDLLKDPYILIAAGSITFGNMGIAMLEPTLPLWMWNTMKSEGWQQGVAFLPCSIAYFIGTNIFGPIAHKIGRGISAGLGMVICGICLLTIPFCTRIEHLIAPMGGLGFSIGMVDSSMMPIMGYLVDLRHVAVYGSVYAIADVAFCLGFAIGPIVSGAMVKGLGFRWMIWFIAIVSLLYSPLTLYLRNPPKRDETRSLVTIKNGNQSKEINSLENDQKSTMMEIPRICLGSTIDYDPTHGGLQEYRYE
ncbi:Synaptic vesicular amine transporter [Schistosoma japonicum]|uniref:Synaptic vesicular amine transporter n=1 Tax=Schistosoma japonicum TaxID=6182 RepID=A0A4Z2D714_SCHJA|nr:Synaptic vesicular amine transporter [Schistosoma japonicum]